MIGHGETLPYFLNMKSISSILFWAFLILATASGNLQARGLEKTVPPKGFFTVYDFENDWLVYSAKYNNYVPFSPDLDENSRSVNLIIDLVKNRNYFLLLHSDTETYVFMEGALQGKMESDEWLQLNIDSLYKVYQTDELLVSLYGNTGISGKKVLICNKKNQQLNNVNVLSASGLVNIKPIFRNPFANFSVIFAVLFLFICSIIYNLYPINFLRLLSPADFFSKSNRDQLAKLNKPINQYVILFVVLLSMLIGYLFVFLKSRIPNQFEWLLFISNGSSAVLILRDFILASIVFFIAFYLKYLLMVLVANMLNLDALVDILFVKTIQSSFVFHGIIYIALFALSVNYLAPENYLMAYFVFPFLIFYFLRFIALYVIINPSGRFINLYLFSYLCVIEVIPLIIGMKFVL